MKRELRSNIHSPHKKVKVSAKNWAPEETETFYEALKKYGKSWNQIQAFMVESGYEARKSGLYNSKYQTYAFNEWWAGRALGGALSGKGHTISGAMLDPYGGKCWAKMYNARFEILKGESDLVLCKCRMIRPSEEEAPVWGENEVELKYDSKTDMWSIKLGEDIYSTKGGFIGFPREETWNIRSESVVLKIRDTGRIRGARKGTGQRRAARSERLPRARRSTAELWGRNDIKVEYEVAYPRNTNREKDKCILGVSCVHHSEGNLGPGRKKLPHLVFRQENLRVNIFDKPKLESVVESAMSSKITMLSSEFTNMKEASNFLWDFTVAKDRSVYEKYVLEEAVLKEWLVSQCRSLKQNRSQRVCIVPFLLKDDSLTLSSPEDSNIQLAIHAQVLAVQLNGENKRRATKALESLEAHKYPTPLTFDSLQGMFVTTTTSELVSVSGDEVSIGGAVKKIMDKGDYFQLHTWKLQKSSPTITWIHHTKSGDKELQWKKHVTVPILAEDRINMRIELQYADKDESWIRDEEKLLLNTFASMLQERFEDVCFAFNKTSTDLPIYMSHVRDNFTHKLFPMETKIGGTIKIDWYMDVEISLPKKFDGLDTNEDCRKQKYVHSGIVTYDNTFSNEELLQIENDCDKTLKMAEKGKFLKNTAQSDPHEGTGPKDRTKFFFNLRYNWRDFELKEPDANFAAGIRSDVSPIQPWMDLPMQRLKDLGVIESTEWINQISFNDYSSANLGLGPHFDDANRFDRPITTIRLFSDSRLSFELRYYGINMGSLIIPLPRGRICVLEKNSYAAEKAKHAVRDCDITERSAALILRHVHDDVEQKAREFQQRKEASLLLAEETGNDGDFVEVKRTHNSHKSHVIIDG